MPENLTLNYRSDEIENKLRSENIFRLPLHTTPGRWQHRLFGVYKPYIPETIYPLFPVRSPIRPTWESEMGLYATAIYESDNERFTASLGLRADANNYSSKMKNMLDQLATPFVVFTG